MAAFTKSINFVSVIIRHSHGTAAGVMEHDAATVGGHGVQYGPLHAVFMID